MGEWALPADQGLAFAAAVRTAEAEGAPWARWLRGGFWRNFQIKYREINDLHKQMLRASAAVDAMPAGPAAELARRHLYQGQSNDCYWHGVFGGIYIPHMRLATHEHLIAASDLAELVGLGADGGDETEATPRAALVDTDLDGIDEILASTAGQVAVIDPNEGGGLGSWDILAVRHALTAVMRRRPEAYHARLLAHEASLAAAAAGTPREVHDEAMTIHDIVRSRETGLTPHLHYDAYERRSGLVHLLAPGTTAAAFAHGSAVELGDAVRGEYELVELEPDRIVLVRAVAIEEPEAVVRVEKRFALGGDRRQPALDLTVDVEHVSGGTVSFDLALEWSLTMLGGGRNPAAYYQVGGERLTHDSIGERSSLAAILSGNDYIGVALETSVEPAATTWWAPIETVSNSEYGFERVYQGSALTFVWPIELTAGKRRTVTVRNVVATAIDRSADELADLRG
jgi:alpha-amylase